MEKVLTSKQIFALEKATVEHGTSIELLMKRAGTAVFEEVIKNYKPCATLVLCGPGNNGGDGFILARLLKKNNWHVTITLDELKNISSLSEATRTNRSKWTGDVIDFKKINFSKYDLIIDALFGIGLHRNIREPYTKIIQATHDKKIISVDIPSGIDSDTGEILGCAIKAELTVTFEYKKPAFEVAHLKKYFGKVVVKKIGLA
jgi:ADP-dependent NAD(P)H-hydrate dehydratase / NAD(P)H-hydrate epimerase